MPIASVYDSSVLARVNQTDQQPTRGESDAIGANFMTLLVAQLQNQDPLKPLENTELTSQLAQINTVSGIEELNRTLQDIDSQINAGQQLQASMLIGRGVMVPGNTVLVGDQGVTTPFGIELTEAAESVTVEIVSEAGEVVRSLELGPIEAGLRTLNWDGQLTSGAPAPQGAYELRVTARGTGTRTLPTELTAFALVNGVSIDPSGEPLLDLGGLMEPVLLSEVRQIL